MTTLSLKELKLHNHFAECGKNAKEWQRKCALMLPEIDRWKIWRKKGFHSIYEYAGKLAGMSRYQVREALRVMRKIEDKPALVKMIEEHGVNKVRPVATIATTETAEFWAEKVKNMSVHTLQVYVAEVRKSHNVVTSQPANLTETVKLNLPRKLARRLDQLQKRHDFNERLKKFLDENEENLPEAIKTESRYIPVQVKRHTLSKTGGKCAFPQCNKPYFQLHHTQRWALEKVHNPTKLQPLCKAHNEIAHFGLIQNEESTPTTWEILKNAPQWTPKAHIDKKVQAHRKFFHTRSK